jgi:hypothetical protein
MESTAALWFLGIIAFSSLIQGAFLVGLAVAGLRLAKQFQELREKVERQVSPALENLARITEDLTDMAETASGHARRLEGLVSDTVDRLEDARGQLQRAAERPFQALRDVAALVKGVKRGMEVYSRLGGLQAQRDGSPRRYEGDEHLFI